jgi:hypothetical protein
VEIRKSGSRPSGKAVVWMQKVTDEEYDDR